MKIRWKTAGATVVLLLGLAAAGGIWLLFYYEPEREPEVLAYDADRAPLWDGPIGDASSQKWDPAEMDRLADDRPHETIFRELCKKYGWPADFDAPLDVEFPSAPEVPTKLLGPSPPIEKLPPGRQITRLTKRGDLHWHAGMSPSRHLRHHAAAG